MFADFVTQADNVLSGYGLAGIAIIGLVLAHIYIHRENRVEIAAKDAEIKRLNDVILQNAKEMQTKYGELAEQQTGINQKVYDMVVQLVSRRRT